MLSNPWDSEYGSKFLQKNQGNFRRADLTLISRRGLSGNHTQVTMLLPPVAGAGVHHHVPFALLRIDR